MDSRYFQFRSSFPIAHPTNILTILLVYYFKEPFGFILYFNHLCEYFKESQTADSTERENK